MRIGDLPCLQGHSIPQPVGDTEGECIYGEYRDVHFNDGFVLRTDNMSPETFFQLFPEEKGSIAPLQHIAHEIVEQYGAWQIQCPELESSVLPYERIERNTNASFHKDGLRVDTHQFDTLLAGSSAVDMPTGETLVATDRLALHLLLSNKIIELGGYLRGQIRKMLDAEDEYADVHLVENIFNTVPLTYATLSTERRQEYTNHFASQTDGVLCHDWEAYNALVISNFRTVHSPNRSAEGVIRRKVMRKDTQMAARQMEKHL